MAAFSDQDWRGMANPDTVAAIHMGKTAARFIQARLREHALLRLNRKQLNF